MGNKILKRINVALDSLLRKISRKSIVTSEEIDIFDSKNIGVMWETTSDLKWVLDDNKREMILVQRHINIGNGAERWFPVPEIT